MFPMQVQMFVFSIYRLFIKKKRFNIMYEGDNHYGDIMLISIADSKIRNDFCNQRIKYSTILFGKDDNDSKLYKY